MPYKHKVNYLKLLKSSFPEKYLIHELNQSTYETDKIYSNYYNPLNNENLLDIIPLGIMLLNKNKRIIIYNNGMDNLSGINKRNAMGKKFCHVFKDKKFIVIKNIVYLSYTLNKEIKEQRFRILNGKFLSISSYLKDNKTLIVIQDISNIKKTEKHVINAEKEALKAQIVSEVFHELRNILANMDINLKLINSNLKNIDEKSKRYLNNINKQMHYIKKCSQDFIKLAHPGQPNLQLSTIEQLIEEVKMLFLEKITDMNILLNIYYQNEIPPIYTDPNQLKQVLINILKNAIEAVKFMGQIKINIKYDNSFLIIKITDNGTGIKKDKLKYIFKPFHTSKKTGTGLGLVISRRIINNLKGDLSIESKVNKGTSCIINIPIKYTHNI